MATKNIEHDELYGVIAQFEDSHELEKAAGAAREAGYVNMDAYSPVPVHGMDETLGRKRSKLPYIVLCGGILGCSVGFGLQVWISCFLYPVNVGGRPFFSWPSFIPIAYECTILFAALSAAFFMCFLNGLLKPYQSIFNAPNFERASIDRFFLCIETEDPKFDYDEVNGFLSGFKTENVADVPR
jgi:hypothetical protein